MVMFNWLKQAQKSLGVSSRRRVGSIDLVPALESRTLLSGGANIDPAVEVTLEETVVVDVPVEELANPDVVYYTMTGGGEVIADDGTTIDGSGEKPVDEPVDPNLEPNVILQSAAGGGGEIKPYYRNGHRPTATERRAAAQLKQQQQATRRNEQKQARTQQAAVRKATRVAARIARLAARPARNRAR